ncbi:hypothetical protein FZ103_17490 [Streptomonospora sp. PA3]|uniref:histidine kinase n=1 Tax=Streptomonospora sp. PA3 TaxID=2607326 RepID=UPI0012DF5366|nr:histidine kinase [Streptomonospora sp. PA3]MUL42939.1 hypothetical protein [Streptomonospora sp. PA3]
MRERWTRRRLVPGRRAAGDAVLWGCCAGLIALEASDVRAAPAAETAAMAVLLAAAFALRRRRPFTALGLALGAAVVQAAVIALTPASTMLAAYLVPCAVLAFSAGRRREQNAPVVAMCSAAALATLAVLGLTWVRMGDLREALSGLTDWAGSVAVLAAVVVAPWLAGRYWRRHAELRTAGWAIAERMERARELDAERARLRERSRIATEMHDSLGHELALIAVRAAALEMAHEGGAREEAAALRTAAHGATLRLREIIGMLRQDAQQPEPGEPAAVAEDAAALVDRAVRAGLDVRLLREGPDPDPASPAGRAVHRVVQEALTNAARYAPGAAVTVRVARARDATTVEVADSGGAGGAPRAPETGGGTGLAGLRSLVEGMGGGFSAGAGAHPGGDDGAGAVGGEARGFTVSARIPDAGGEPPAAAPGGTETARRLRAARRSARRWLVTALAVPAGLAGGTVAAGFAALWYVGANSVLPADDYARLSVGQDRAAVERVLPRFDYPAREVADPPPAPAGSTCRFYLVEWENGLPPVYRLCFSGGRLAAKDTIVRT